MSVADLANADPATAWAHQPWTAFGPAITGQRAVAILPVHGFADHGLGLPLDAEELVGSALLRRAVAALGGAVQLRVLPPLRFGLAPYPSTFFGVDADTAHEQIEAVATAVQAAGIERVVFLCTSPWNAELVAAASLAARARLGLHTYVIGLAGLGLDFHPAGSQRAQAQAAAASLLGQAPANPTRAADIIDPQFRPGQYRQPSPLPFTGQIDGAAVISAAAARFAGLLAEIVAHRAPAAATPPVVGPVTEPAGESHWPSYRKHYLGALTRDELEALPDKDSALVILPTGAIEQHGPHLPVGVDAILGQARVHHVLPLLPAGSPVYVAPPLTYGASAEHAAFPGTVSLPIRTLRRLVLAAAAQLRALGFRRLALLNTHGGNSAVLVYTLRELQDGPAFRAGLLGNYASAEQDPQEAAYGFHAGEMETSLMLACAPEWVRLDRVVCEYPAQLTEPGLLRPEQAPAVFSWLTQDISQSGVMGDATRATVAKGVRWMTEASLALADRIEQVRQAP